MIGSFRVRLFVAMLGVALLASVVTAGLVQRQTTEAFEDAARQDLEVDTAIFDEILIAATFAGTWDDIDATVDELSAVFDRRIAVTTLDDRVLADSDAGAPLPEQPAAVLEPSIDDLLEFVGPDELVASGEIFFDELDEGDLEQLFGDDGFVDALDDDLLGDLEPLPPGLLYLGYPADELLSAASFDPLEILLTVGLVAGVALVIAGLLAGRISRPVRSLTAAAGALGRGDLEARVEGSTGGEVGELATAFNTMADDLERGERARRQLVTDVAHELRNPIGVLLGNLEAAQDGLFPTDRALVDLLHDETRHLSALVDDLGELAAADAGRLRVEPETVDVLATAVPVIDAHRGPAAERGLTLDLIGDPVLADPVLADPVLATVDPRRYRQIVTNLVSNAIAYTEQGGVVVEVAADVDDGRPVAVISVADTGPGLDAEARAHVFDRFWRADAARHRNSGGAGLGLAICAELVAASDGTIDVAPRPGGGSVFTVRLPAASP